MPEPEPEREPEPGASVGSVGPGTVPSDPGYLGPAGAWVAAGTVLYEPITGTWHRIPPGPDAASDRAVVWTELARPEHAAIEALEQAAMSYTARELLAKGLALGINRTADLIVLGRSVEQDALAKDEGVDLVAEVAKEAAVADAELAGAAGPKRPNGAAPYDGGDAVIFRN